jgi:rubrerythrin
MDQERNTCIEQAIQMEKDGKDFYLQAASNVTSPTVRMIFEELAREEDYHIRKIGEILSAMQKTQTVTEWVTCVIGESKLDSLFGDIVAAQAKASTSEIDALNIALQLEEKNMKYYDELAN